jgi:hypothetical protein
VGRGVLELPPSAYLSLVRACVSPT